MMDRVVVEGPLCAIFEEARGEGGIRANGESAGKQLVRERLREGEEAISVG
jgi:hypothetical protein